MPKIHPKAEIWKRQVDHLSPEARAALRHALDCPVCRPLVAELLDASGPRDRPGPEPHPPGVLAWRAPRPDYGTAFVAALERVAPRAVAAERERAAAPPLLDELMRLSDDEREALVEREERFLTLALADLLVERSREESYHDPGRGERLALLAVRIVDRIAPEAVGPRVLADARARCWATVGNARRISSDLRGADEAFARAERELARGTRDPLEKARFLNLKASLLRAQRRFADAFAMLERAIELFKRDGDAHAAGRATLNLALGYKEAGEPGRAIELLREAGRLIDREADSRLNLMVVHNLIDALVESGSPLEARALLARSRRLYGAVSDEPSRLRARWVEGKIAHALAQPDEATEAFREVREGFVRLGDGYDAALAALDLAGVYVEEGRTGELRQLAAEMLPIFRSRDVHREALAALTVFQHAAAAETAGIDLVRQVAGYLGRARHDPTLRFEPTPGTSVEAPKPT